MLIRFHPGGFPFYLGVGARLGAQRFQGSRLTEICDEFSCFPSREDASNRYALVQPGAEVGAELRHVDLGLRFFAGIPAEGKLAGVYTVMFNLGFRLAEGGW